MSKIKVRIKNKRRKLHNKYSFLVGFTNNKMAPLGGNWGRGCYAEEYYHTDLNGNRIETNPFTGERRVMPG